MLKNYLYQHSLPLIYTMIFWLSSFFKFVIDYLFNGSFFRSFHFNVSFLLRWITVFSYYYTGWFSQNLLL